MLSAVLWVLVVRRVMVLKTIRFNQSIGAVDTSSVTSMGRMFRITSAFNQQIGTWDTSVVRTMARTFRNNSAFNQPIGGRVTSSVTTVIHMFRSKSVFNQPSGAQDTSSVTDLEMRDAILTLILRLEIFLCSSLPLPIAYCPS